MSQLTHVRELARLHRQMRQSLLTSPYRHGPVRIAILRCSDGRMCLFNQALGICPGRCFDMRAIGAKKSMASYPFRDRVNDWYRGGGDHHVMLLAYHNDRIERELGCAGHGYDTQAALAAQLKLAHNIKIGWRGRIHALVIGYETRLGEVVLHGDDGRTLRTSELGNNQHEVMSHLIGLWSSVPIAILQELIPMFLHNAEHVRSNIERGAMDIPRNHQEVGVVVGRHLGWIMDSGDALQVVPIEDTAMHPNTEIGTGVHLLQSSLENKRIPVADGVFTMTCIPYWERDDMKEASEVAAIEWADMISDLVHTKAPEIEPYLIRLVAVIGSETRAITLLEGPPGARELFHPEMIQATGSASVEFV